MIVYASSRAPVCVSVRPAERIGSAKPDASPTRNQFSPYVRCTTNDQSVVETSLLRHVAPSSFLETNASPANDLSYSSCGVMPQLLYHSALQTMPMLVRFSAIGMYQIHPYPRLRMWMRVMMRSASLFQASFVQ